MAEPTGSDGEDRLAAIAVAFSDDSRVTLGHGRRGFGAGTLMVDGRIFALVSDDRLVLKLPAARVIALIDAGRGLPWSAGKPVPLREWVAIAKDEPAWLDLANEAVAFVGRRGGESAGS